MLRILLAIALIALVGLVVFAREDADTPLVDEEEPARTAPRETEPPRRPRLRPARCPPGVEGCRSVTGRIVFVESVDPDGDGDLHVVVAAGSITLPGVTAVDVMPSLRPRRDPSVGDHATAAGPVQRGTYGQRQIHALRFAVRR